jgi:putative ABC transport system permease protein
MNYGASDVVDLCSSDEDEDKRDSPRKPSSSRKNPPSRKDPPVVRKKNILTSATFGGTVSASRTSPAPSKIHPSVDLCSSGEESDSEKMSSPSLTELFEAPPRKEDSLLKAANEPETASVHLQSVVLSRKRPLSPLLNSDAKSPRSTVAPTDFPRVSSNHYPAKGAQHKSNQIQNKSEILSPDRVFNRAKRDVPNATFTHDVTKKAKAATTASAIDRVVNRAKRDVHNATFNYDVTKKIEAAAAAIDRVVNRAKRDVTNATVTHDVTKKVEVAAAAINRVADATAAHDVSNREAVVADVNSVHVINGVAKRDTLAADAINACVATADGNNNKIIVNNVTNNESTSSTLLENISTVQKRILLGVLAPESSLPEVIDAEDWEKADEPSVLNAFSERFEGLDSKDLQKLVNGEFLVPKGMISVKQILGIYLEKLEKKEKEESTGKNEPQKQVTLLGINVNNDSLSYGEETVRNRRRETENNFQWDGTFRLLLKDRSVDKASGTELAKGTTNDGNSGQKDENKDRSSFKGVHKDGKTQDSQTGDSSEREIQSRDSDENKSKEGHKFDNFVLFDEILSDNIETSQQEDKCDEQGDSAKKDEIEDWRTHDSLAGDSSEKENSSRDSEGKIFENPILFEQLSDNFKASESKDKDAGEGDATKGVPKKSDSFVENTVVEYREDQKLPTEEIEGHKVASEESREILGEIVTSIIDSVTTRCNEDEEQHPKNIETEICLEDEGRQRQLELDGTSEVNLSVMSIGKEEKQEENHSLVDVSSKQLLLLAIPLVSLATILRRLGLFDVSNSIFEGCFRTFIQLHVLGNLLSPIFKHGVKHPGLVGCYALFMIILASYEASSRTKYTHEGQFTIIVQSLVLNVGWVAMWAFGAILKPQPVWNPRYVLPIVGMLLGNAINGISITLDTITTSLVEKQSEVELYLSFGANQYEAVSGIVAHAIQKGTTPALNMMCVVGIVSIPGMMTGQILGGSSPMTAARYQAMIIFMIALSTLSTILLSSCLTVVSAFCSHQILQPDKFVKNRKRGLARLILWAWGYVFGSGNDVVPLALNGIHGGTGGSLHAQEETNVNLHPSAKAGFEIRPLKKGSVFSDGEGLNSLLQASGLHRYFQIGDGSNHETDDRRVLFRDLSFDINEGDLLLVSGPSGTGKSQLLRMVAGLSPLQEGAMWLQRGTWEDDYNGNHAVEWRKQIRYVTQSKVQIPGTPLQFVKKIKSFQSWKMADYNRNDAFTTNYDVIKHVSHHIRQWGMSISCLEKEWSVLSGGESQRVLMAIALASRPKILLFDESTSALDHKSKLAVETSIKDFVEDHEGGVLWVTHDEQQVQRMMDESE